MIVRLKGTDGVPVLSMRLLRYGPLLDFCGTGGKRDETQRPSHPCLVILSRVPEVKPSLPRHPEPKAKDLAEGGPVLRPSRNPPPEGCHDRSRTKIPSAPPPFSARSFLGRTGKKPRQSDVQHCPHLVKIHLENLTAEVVESAERTNLHSRSDAAFCAWVGY